MVADVIKCVIEWRYGATTSLIRLLSLRIELLSA